MQALPTPPPITVYFVTRTARNMRASQLIPCWKNNSKTDYN